MDEKLIEAAEAEMRIHALRFTMEDLARRLRASKTSIYKAVPSKETLVRAVLDRKIRAFRHASGQIHLSGESADQKILQLIQLFTDVFGAVTGNILGDVEAKYPSVWSDWQTFYRQCVGDVMGIIRAGMDAGLYREVNLTLVETCLIASMGAFSEAGFLHRSRLTYTDAVGALGDVLLNGLKNRP